MDKINELAKEIKQADKVVVLTGAGISVPSGIPDFRTPGTGIWENVEPSSVANITVFANDPDRFWSFYGDRFAMLGPKQPNEAHKVLAELEEEGLIEGVITQNIDCLHVKAGTQNLTEMHGSIQRSSCLNCGATYDLDAVVAKLDEGPTPKCDQCEEAPAIKPSVVLFGEQLRDSDLQSAYDLCIDADLIIAIGSSLVVQPVATLPGMVKDIGGKIALITKSNTPYDHEADIIINDDVEEVMKTLREALK